MIMENADMPQVAAADDQLSYYGSFLTIDWGDIPARHRNMLIDAGAQVLLLTRGRLRRNYLYLPQGLFVQVLGIDPELMWML